MKISLEKIIILFVSLSVLAFLSVLVFFFYNTQQIKSNGDLVVHTQEVINKSNDVLLDITDIESGLRGYVLTENKIFLEPFDKAITVRNGNLAALAELIKDNPNQIARVVLLKKASDQRLASTKILVGTLSRDSLNEASKIMILENGKITVDHIRAIVTDINSEEFRLLHERKIENERSNRNSESIFLALIVLLCVILALLAAIIKNQRARNKIAGELEKAVLIAESATEKAQESTKLKETFLANMSHEIRTPMNAIMGFSEILSKGSLGTKEVEYVSMIKLAGRNLLVIINDILDISKIEAGMMSFEERVFSVREIFKSLNVMLRGNIKEKKLDLLFTCDEDVPDWLLGDPLRLTQVIINLAGNAIKFTQTGNVSVSCKALSNENGTVLLEFSVTDTGIGIPKDKLENIFERFRQAESQTTRKYGGSGLGLSIAKQLVELQHGSLTVKSELNTGSVFSFCIPYRESVEKSSEKIVSEGKYSMEELSKLNILLVEDNPLNIILITSLFSEHNLKLQVAENGSLGIDKLRTDDFNIILMDMEMPVMNGYEATTIIRKELNSNVPIIAMTAHAMAGEKERCLSLGMNDYISKPIDANLLFGKIYDLTLNL